MASDDLPSSQRGFWAAEKILSERRERGERLVLVQWEGTDDNGEKWKPTWEPVGNCTEELVEEWEEEKRLKKEKSNKRKRSTTSTARGRSRTSSARSNSTASTVKDKDKEPERPRKRQRRDMEAEVKSEDEMPPPRISEGPKVKKPIIRRDEEEEEEDRPAPRRPSSVSLGKIKRKPSEARFEPVQYDYDDIPPRLPATAGPSRSKSSSIPPCAPSSEPESPPSLRAKLPRRRDSDSDSPPPAKSKPSTSKFRPNAATIARSRAPLKRKAREDPYVSSSDSDSGKGKGKALEVEGEGEEVMKVGPPRGKRPSKPLLKKPSLPSRNSVPAPLLARKPGPASRTSAPAPAPAPKQAPFVLDPSLKSAGLPPPTTKPPLVPSKPKPKPAPAYPHESYETAARRAIPTALEEEEDTQAAGPSPFKLGPGPRPVYEPVSDYMRHAQTVGEYMRVNGVGNVEAARRNAEMNAVAGPSKVAGSSKLAPGLEKVVAPSQGSIVPGTQSTRPDDDSREEEGPPPAPVHELSPVYARSISPVVHSHVDSPPRPRSASPPRSSPQVKRTYGRKGSGARVRDVGGDESIVAATVTVDDEEPGQGQGDVAEEEEKEVTPASARDLTLAPDPEFSIVAATTPAPVASEREESSASEEEEEESEEDEEDEDAEEEDEEIRSQASLPPSPSQAQPQPQPHAFRAIAPRIPITATRIHSSQLFSPRTNIRLTVQLSKRWRQHIPATIITVLFARGIFFDLRPTHIYTCTEFFDLCTLYTRRTRERLDGIFTVYC